MKGRDRDVEDRLEYLRSQIEAEQISYGEIAELEGLAEHIDPSDVVLLEWAGVPEHDDHSLSEDEAREEAHRKLREQGIDAVEIESHAASFGLTIPLRAAGPSRRGSTSWSATHE